MNSVANMIRASKKIRLRWLLSLIAFLPAICSTSIVYGYQNPNQPIIPSIDYYRSYDFLRDGRTEEADAGFRVALRPLNIPLEQRGFESIPSIVMLGETYYHQGHILRALEQFEDALLLASKYSSWMRQVEPIANTEKVEMGKGITWGQSLRKTQVARTASRWQFVVIPNGVAFHSPVGGRAPTGATAVVDAVEIARTTALALRRRWQILGSVAKGNELSRALEVAFAGNLGLTDPTMQASLRLCHALSMLPNQQYDQVQLPLRNATTLGEFDYALTPTGLMVQAEIAAESNDFNSAAKYYFEAALSAAQHDQFEMVAEAIQNWSMIAASQRDANALTTLQQVNTWALKRSRFILASASAGSAAIHIARDELAPAAASLQKLKAILAPRDVVLPRFEGFGYWIAARLAFENHNPRDGLEALDLAIRYGRGEKEDDPLGQRELRLHLLVKEALAGKANVEQMRKSWSQLFADPKEVEWIQNPVETLAWLKLEKGKGIEFWIQSELLHGNPTELASAVDAAKRLAFLKLDPIGGRLLAVKQLLQWEPTKLEGNGGVEATRWRKAHEKLDKALLQANVLLEKGAAYPPQLDLRSMDDAQRAAWEGLAVESVRMENRFSAAALSNLPCTVSVPPNVAPSDWSSRFQSDEVVVAYFESGGNLHGVGLSGDKAELWKVGPVTEIQAKVASLMEYIGLGAGEISESKERDRLGTLTTDLRRRLLPKGFQSMLKPRSKVTFVPVGFLWYLPFDLLPETMEGGPSLLVYHPISYAGTIGVATRNRTSSPTKRTIAFSAPKYFSEQEDGQKVCIERLQAGIPGNRVIPDVTGVGPRWQPSRWARAQGDRFCILGRIPVSENEPIAPFGYSSDSEDGLLSSWSNYPMKTPKELVMPGIETGLVRGVLGNGNELFLLACTFPATGNQAALLSRWPMRGESSASLLSTYLSSLDHESASDAWRRSVLANWEEKFAGANEPALMGKVKSASGTNPLLWSGYFLVGDTQPN